MVMVTINRGSIGAMPMVGQTPRSRQGSGDTGRGRRRISTARGDVAQAAAAYYNQMLIIQQNNAFSTLPIKKMRKKEKNMRKIWK